jgi:hypothetical protein
MNTPSTSPKWGNVIHLEYQGVAVGFTGDGWFNATEAAARFGKEPYDWLNQRETAEYLVALAQHMGKANSGFLKELSQIKDLAGTSAASKAKLLRLAKQTGLVKSKAGAPETGGGTWLHPKLAVRFAQWLDIRFAVWCDAQIDSLIRGKPQDWRKLRSEAATGYKVVSAVLQATREAAGKATEPHHYANEARMINALLDGRFAKLDRDNLPPDALALLVQLEARDAVLMAQGADYQVRKQALERFATDWRASRSRALALEAA